MFGGQPHSHVNIGFDLFSFLIQGIDRHVRMWFGRHFVPDLLALSCFHCMLLTHRLYFICLSRGPFFCRSKMSYRLMTRRKLNKSEPERSRYPQVVARPFAKHKKERNDAVRWRVRSLIWCVSLPASPLRRADETLGLRRNGSVRPNDRIVRQMPTDALRPFSCLKKTPSWSKTLKLSSMSSRIDVSGNKQ